MYLYFGSICHLLPFYRITIFASSIFNPIANEKLNIGKLREYFKGQSIFGSREIAKFFRQFEPKIKTTAVNWRVYTLVQLGVLSRVGRGKFILGEGRNFVPQVASRIKILYNKLHKQFPYLQICLWNTSVLNELMIHQPGRFYTLVEAEKDTIESVFYFLKDIHKNVFLDPTSDILSHYASSEKEAIIVKPLVSEAPIQNVQGVRTITIEKMLVDIFCDEVIFAAQQGSEMQTIFKNAFEKYTMNENKMLRYADRRRKKEVFNNYLNKVSKFRQLLM